MTSCCVERCKEHDNLLFKIRIMLAKKLNINNVSYKCKYLINIYSIHNCFDSF